MANTSFYVPALRDAGAWQDVRNQFPGGSYGNRNIANVRYVVIHHTVTRGTGNGMEDLRLIANGHNGHIPYNVVVTSEHVGDYAKTFYTGDLGTIRATNPNRKGAMGIPAQYGNLYTFSIAIIGRYDGGNGNPSDQMLRSMNLVAQEAIFNEDARFGGIHNTWDSLIAHKDLDYTACPGEFQNYRHMIVTPPAISNQPAPQPPTRWQDTDFREEAHRFTVKHRVEIKDFDTLEVKGVLVEGQEVETQYVSNDNRWYATRWALDNNKRHGVLIEDMERDQLVVPVVAPEPEHTQETQQEAPQEPQQEEVVVDVPLDTNAAPITTEEPTTATKDVTQTVGKYLGPTGVTTVAALTAWQQFFQSLPPYYLWVVLFVVFNIALIVLYKKWPWLNQKVNAVLEKCKLK